MRVCLDDNGNKRFKTSEYLTASQIISHFSRLAAQVRQPDVSDDDIDSAILLINKAEALQEISLSLTKTYN